MPCPGRLRRTAVPGTDRYVFKIDFVVEGRGAVDELYVHRAGTVDLGVGTFAEIAD